MLNLMKVLKLLLILKIDPNKTDQNVEVYLIYPKGTGKKYELL